MEGVYQHYLSSIGGVFQGRSVLVEHVLTQAHPPKDRFVGVLGPVGDRIVLYREQFDEEWRLASQEEIIWYNTTMDKVLQLHPLRPKEE